MWTSTLRAVAFTLMLTMTWTTVMAGGGAVCDVTDLGGRINVAQVLAGTDGYIYKMFQIDNLSQPLDPVHIGFYFGYYNYPPDYKKVEFTAIYAKKPNNMQCRIGLIPPLKIHYHGFSSSGATTWIIAHDDSHVVMYFPKNAQLTIYARTALPVNFDTIAAATLQRIKQKCGEAAGNRAFYPREFLPGKCE